MAVAPPPVDPRDFAQLVRATKARVRASLGLPAPPEGEDPPVPGEGLVHIFARLAEIVVERVNRVPDKNLLAFLSLVGVDRQPPQAARAPIRFQLAEGATAARVLAGTAVEAAALEGEAEPPVFETERELVLTAAAPLAAFTREPAQDRYRDAAGVTTPEGSVVPVFAGDTPIAHELGIADPLFALPQPKLVSLRIRPVNPAQRWPDALAWSYFDGLSWQDVVPTVRSNNTFGGVWQLDFAALPAVQPTSFGGVTGSWLRARLDTPLPPGEGSAGTIRQTGLAADAALADERPLDPEGPLAPFGESVPRNTFALACGRAFSKPGARVSIDVDVDTDRPATPAASLALRWLYWNGTDLITLGTSSPASGADPQGDFGFVDGTQALTRDGTITFTAPPGWAAHTLGGVLGHWLLADIVAGDFGTPPAYAAPVLERVAIAYEWPLPEIWAVLRTVAIRVAARPADAALFGTEELDLTKDFGPFGERPRFNDVFYLACDEALSLPGARVTLRVTGTKAVSAAGQPAIAWEVYDGAARAWVPARVRRDTTGAFTFANGLEALVDIDAPASPAPFAPTGEEHFWVRARLVGGNYGVDASFHTITNDRGDVVVVPDRATWDPPSIKSISIDYSFDSNTAAPDELVALNDWRATVETVPFTPFTVVEDRRPTFYLGWSGDLGNDATTLFLDVPEVTYGGGRPAPLPEPAAVVWEYRRGDGWQPLGTRDETRGFAARGLLAFVAPADIVPSTEFGVEARWLRARWERGGYVRPPQLARVLTNTVWASHMATVRDEVLGSSTGEESQVFATAQSPVLPGERIEVREVELPSGADLPVILAEEGEDAVTVVPPVPGVPGETWVRWHGVVDFYGSGPRSRHYVLDRLTGQVRFGDGRRGMAPPQGQGNVRATLYRTGGGAVGNRPEGAIVQLKSAVPSVDSASNPAPSAGGADAESLDAVRERGPRLLRHGNRAVTIADVEDLAREASPGVARVLGVPAATSADAGGVGVVVVPATAARQPVPSVELLDRVRVHLEQRLPAGADLWVAGPGWLRIGVAAEVVPVSLEQATDVQSAVRSALDAFLHPLSGGPRGEGWPFGRAPRRSDLLAVIEGLPGVDHVRGLSLEQEETSAPPADSAVLVYSADHEITMAGSTEGAA
jgi:hypothetical protein